MPVHYVEQLLVVLVKFRFDMNAPSTVGHEQDRVSVKVARQSATGMAARAVTEIEALDAFT